MPKGVYQRTEYHRTINANGHRGIPSPNKGKHIHSKESLKKIGDASRLAWLRPGYKKKMLNRKIRNYTKAHRDKLRESFIGKNNPLWKEKPSYHAIHIWVKNHKGKPKRCEHCSTTEKRIYHWANIDHKYRRNIEDYLSLCPKCHKKFDKTIDRFSEKVGGEETK